MKKIFLFCVVTSLALTGFAAQLKIAVVNMDKIFQNYYKTKITDASLKQQFAVFQANVRRLQSSLLKLEKEYETLVNASQMLVLSSSSFSKNEKAIKTKEQDIREKKIQLKEYSEKRNKYLKGFYEKRRKVILEDIRDEINRRVTLEGYSFIFDISGKTLNGVSAVVYYNPTFDITDDIVKALNRGHNSAIVTGIEK